MNNKHGLDAAYFRKNLKMLVRDVDNYTPEEMARALNRLSQAAVPKPALPDEVQLIVDALERNPAFSGATEHQAADLLKRLARELADLNHEYDKSVAHSAILLAKAKAKKKRWESIAYSMQRKVKELEAKTEALESKLRTYAMFDVQTASELAEDLAAKEKRIEELAAILMSSNNAASDKQ